MMDGSRFDDLTRALAAPASRRAVLKGMAAGALGVAFGVLGMGETAANHYFCRHVGAGCTSNGQCCSGRCRGTVGHQTCHGHHAGGCEPTGSYCLTGAQCGNSGFCWQTTGRAAFCGGSGECANCTKDSQCTAITGPGSACVTEDGGNCFGCSGTRCAAPR